jgi:hypothetical protein
LLNFSREAEPTIEPDPALKQLLAAGPLVDVLSGDRFRFDVGKPLHLRMAPTSVRVLVPAGAAS